MSDILIKITGDMAQVSRIIDGRLQPIKFMGNESISIINDFWETFKSKVEEAEYGEVAFILVTDNVELAIDSSIKIAEKFINSNEEIAYIIDGLSYENSKIILFPELVLSISHRKFVEEGVSCDEYVHAQEIKPVSDSVQEFYRKKSIDYKRS